MAGRKRKAADDGGGSAKKRDADTGDGAGGKRVTRSMKTDGPRQAVFNTAELLEQIMLHLPAKTVFGIQRVCRQFRDLVATSAAIRQKLFLQTSGAETPTWMIRPTKTVSPFWEYFEFYDVSKNAPDEGVRYTTAKLNPFVESGRRENSPDLEGIYYNKGEPVLTTFPMELGSMPSWRDMFLTDPPCESVRALLFWKTAKETRVVRGWIERQVKNPNGVTLGAVVDAALHDQGDISYLHNRRAHIEKDRSLKDVMDEMGVTGRIKLSTEDRSCITLKRVVIPTEYEWNTVPKH